MSITTFNQFPYYDDFDDSKNYMRILFRPGYSVQARELNQLQTSIQAQIDKFGRSIYKENSKVLGGEISVNNSVPYVKVEEEYLNYSTNGDLNNNIRSYLEKNSDGSYKAIGTILRGTARGSSPNDLGNVRAEIIDIVPPVYESTNGSSSIKYPLTLQLRYLNSGGTPNAADDSFVNMFSPDEILVSENNSFIFKTLSIDSNGQYPTGYGTRLFVEEGVYFVKGCFIHVPKESINISTYSQTPYRRVVYNIVENIVTSAQDSSLNDNSIGTPNESAPGANRYQILLSLTLDSFDSYKKLGKNVIEVAKIREGKLFGTEITQYSELAKVLARRTYEESGNYYLSPIPLKSNELLKDTSDLDTDYSSGIYTENQISNFYGVNNSNEYGRQRLALSVGKGGNIVYVYGYRVEFLESQIISTLKARDTQIKNNSSVDSQIGNYLICSLDESSSSSEINLSYEPVNIYNSTNELIGTARIRNVEYHSSTQIKVFLSNVEQEFDTDGIQIDSLTNLSYLVGDTFTLNVVESTFISENNHSYIFKNPCEATKSVGDLSYVVRDSILTSSSSAIGDEVTISVKNNYEQFEYTGIDSFLIIDVDNNEIVNFESISLFDSNKKATITFDSANAIPTNFIVYFNIKRTEQSGTTSLRRVKTLRETNEIIENPNRIGGGIDTLINYDIKRIIGVYASTENENPTPADIDITDSYILDSGQRENYYDLGGIRLRCGCDGPPEESKILVQYEYYEWSSGEYSTVDSYYSPEISLTSAESFKYETIPTFNSKKYGEINLRDVVDFRPKKESIENQTAITLARFPRIIGDFTHYLPRIDKLYLNKNGSLGIVRGLSSENPNPPEDPQEVMVLYSLYMNAYTFTPNDFRKIVHNHRRYTMRDIGKLDQRISNLEKFTQLNNLEVETENEQILDENGDDRFKNGFIADSCGGHILGYTKDYEYSVSINPITGEMHPTTNSTEIRFLFDEETTTSEFRNIGPNLMLPFTEVKHSGSPYATKEVLDISVGGSPVSVGSSYSLTTDKKFVIDGEVINFNISTVNVEDGTKVWWVMDKVGIIEGYSNKRAGLITIQNNEANFSLTVDLVNPVTENKNILVTLRKDVDGIPEGGIGTIPNSFREFGIVTVDQDITDLIPAINFIVTPTPVENPTTYIATPYGPDAVGKGVGPSASRLQSTYIFEKPGKSPKGQTMRNYIDVSVKTTNVPEGTVLYWDMGVPVQFYDPSVVIRSPQNYILEDDFSDSLSLRGTVTIGENGIGKFRKVVSVKEGLRPGSSGYGNGAALFGYSENSVSVKSFQVNFRLAPANFRAYNSGNRTYIGDPDNIPVATTGLIYLVDNGIDSEEFVEIIPPTEPLEGVIEFSPQSDNYYENNVRPIIAFDDELQGIFDVIKNSPNRNDEFLSKYIWEGDTIYWTGKDKFNPETDGLGTVKFDYIAGDSIRKFRHNFYNYGIPNERVAEMEITGGGTIVSEEIIPKMRSRKIYFKASGLKPNTRYIPLFGGVNVSNYVSKENSFVLFKDRDAVESTQLYTGLKNHPLSLANSNLKKLISDSKGELIGSFIIPNNDELSFDTRTNVNFVLSEDVDNSEVKKSFAITTYKSDGRRKITNMIAYVYLPNEVNSVDQGPRIQVLNENEIEGYEFLNSSESNLSNNLDNLSKFDYYLERYEELIVVSTNNNGTKNVSRNLTLIERNKLASTTQSDYETILLEQGKILNNISHSFNNVSGLYISNGSSSKIDYRFFGQTQKESDNYLKTLDNGTYKMYYIRIITDNENENSSNPMSSSPSFNTNVQYEIGTNLNNLNGNTTIKPSDSNI